jgi:hypothetical protein
VRCGGPVERGLSLEVDLLGGAEVHRSRGVHSDPGMPVFVVVGQEEALASSAGNVDRQLVPFLW